jgi:hypothetical protein
LCSGGGGSAGNHAIMGKAAKQLKRRRAEMEAATAKAMAVVPMPAQALSGGGGAADALAGLIDPDVSV